MTCENLKKLLNDPINVLVDVRTSYEYQQARITGSMSIPLHELPHSVDHLKGKNVYVYCRSGARSGQAEMFLKGHGINSVNIGGLTSFMGCLSY